MWHISGVKNCCVEVGFLVVGQKKLEPSNQDGFTVYLSSAVDRHCGAF